MRGGKKQWLTREDTRPEFYKNRVNAGLHIINTELLALSGIKPENIDTDHKVDDISKVENAHLALPATIKTIKV